MDDLLGDQRRPRDRLDHRQLAALDAPRDLDLAFAREQRHGPHLAQIHADRVVGLVERARRQVELELLGALAGPVDRLVVAQVLLVGVDDLDAGAAERIEQVVQLFGRGDFGRQELVDLVVEEVALLFADVDELSYFVVFFFDRQKVSPLATFSSSIRCARVRFWFKSRLMASPCWPNPSPCSRSISRWMAARSRSQRSRFRMRAHSVRSPGPMTGAACSPAMPVTS